MRVDEVEHPAPEVDVAPVAGQQQRVGKRERRAPVVGAVGELAVARHLQHREAPAVDAAVPAVAALDRAVEADAGRDQAAVLLGALDPGVDVLEHPVAVPLLAGQRVGGRGRAWSRRG